MNNQVYHIKLIDMQYQFVWKIIEEGGILVQKIKTTDNLAYALTKVVIGIKLKLFLELDRYSSSLMKAHWLVPSFM